MGTFNATDGCYWEAEKTEPDPDTARLAVGVPDDWKTGDKGSFYNVTCPGAPLKGGLTYAAAPPNGGVDPAQLAREALSKMKLAAPDININPKPGGKGLVGMPVWMAVDQSPTTYGPNSATATAGGVTVTATAKVKSIVWNMGDGTSVTCNGPGTLYRKSFGMKQSPDCGHVYKQTSDSSADGKFNVSATATWAVDWQVAGGGGETGQLTEVRNSQVGLTIIESQAVN
ncbi:ATP/GTP-binding protein [Streptomyces sp. NPDC048527]|uniref:ATP/GTP-binding protein n=1 Tax=Streptomyces sp. NPDC048527 TaxID=3365568 RepID=UPI00371E8D64